jgi:mono/diheme cytochrome c family protein
MSARIVLAGLAGTIALCVSGLATAQGKPDFGKREYTQNCASCHGAGGKGDGAMRGYLTKSPTDLTTLAKRNNGVFPYQRVYEVIDGRQVVEPHGGRDMPVWGADYIARSAQDWQDWPYDPESYARARIVALTDYLNRIQAK